MSDERLSDEQLEKWHKRWPAQWVNEQVDAMIVELLALRTRVAELETSRSHEGGMREAAQRVVDDILEYERVNNLSPNPPRIYCWDSVAALVAALATLESKP